MKTTIPRALEARLREYLAIFPAVVLVGPRQVGKTTLAHAITADVAADADSSVYLDLENPRDLDKLADVGQWLADHQGRLVVLDEVHRVPELFPVLRGVIDERIRNGETAGQFLLLGSASVALLRQAGETLAGRVATLELGPFDVREFDEDAATRLWLRGGFPSSLLAASDRVSAIWRDNFVTTYLERDIPMLGPRIPAATLRRFWAMLAHDQGTLWNAARLAKSLGLSGKTVTHYLDLMVDLLLVRRLPPLHANTRKRLVKSPKVYVRDSGLVHSLLRLDDREALYGHPVAGLSWEGFVIESLLRAAPPRTEASFYRTATGVEVDLVLDLPNRQRWAVEVKLGRARVERPLHIAIEDVRPDRAFVVYGDDERFSLGVGIEAIGLRELASEVAVPSTAKPA